MKLSHKNCISILKKTGIFISASLLLFTFAGCTLLPKEDPVMAPVLENTPKVTYDTVEVKKGSIVNELTAQGNFVPVTQKDVFFEQRGGNIARVYVKAGDSVKAGDVLAELDTSDIQEQIKEENINLQIAGIDLEQVKSTKGASTYDIQKAELALQKEQLIVDDLNAQLENSKLIAGISGQITYSADPEVGEYVDAYQTLFTIADSDSMQIECTGQNIGSFKNGMKVNIEYGNKTYTGTVIRSPQDTSDSGSGSEDKSMKVKMDSIPEGAKLGDTVSVSVELQKKDNVIVISKDFVKKYGDTPYVEVLIDGTKVEKNIETGIENGDSVEVVKGLSEGDQLIK